VVAALRFKKPAACPTTKGNVKYQPRLEIGFDCDTVISVGWSWQAVITRHHTVCSDFWGSRAELSMAHLVETSEDDSWLAVAEYIGELLDEGQVSRRRRRRGWRSPSSAP
jgi:hypothetical protein